MLLNGHGVLLLAARVSNIDCIAFGVVVFMGLSLENPLLVYLCDN